MSRPSNPRARAVQGAVGAVVLGAALFALPGLATAAESGTTFDAAAPVSATPDRTAPAPVTTTSGAAASSTSTTTAAAATTTATTAATTTPAAAPTARPAVEAPAGRALPSIVPACLPLSAGAFQHTFDAKALTLTVSFVPTDTEAAGATLCGGGQPFTMATWATQEPGYTLPQRLLGTSEKSVTVAGTVGQVVVTAPSPQTCAAQVDAYMAPASAVPTVLTGFNTGESRGGSGAGAVNEPPLVGTPQAPYRSTSTTAGQPYVLVTGMVCTLPAQLTPTVTCTDGTATGTLLVHNPNPWTVRYEVLLNGTEVSAPELADPGVAGGATGSLSGQLDPGTYTVRVIDENGVAATTTADVAACDPTTTTTAPPTTTTAPPTTTTAPTTTPSVEATTTQRTVAPTTTVEVSGVVVTRTTSAVAGGSGGTTGTGGLASTGASVALPLGLGGAALLVGGGLLLLGRGGRARHAR